MRKKLLGIICLLYFGIIIYVWTTGSLKNFLAPNLQIYLKLSAIPFFVMGVIILFNKKINYQFKISDVILLLPLIMLILAGDAHLTSSFALNRMSSFSTQTKINKDEVIEKEQVKEIIEIEDSDVETREKEEEEYDFSHPYFDVVDANYDDLANYLTFAEKASKYAGYTIRVRGFIVKYADYIPSTYFAIGKYSITCCAADAEFTGFIAKYDLSQVRANGWYEIEGVLEPGIYTDGYDIMTIKVINIKEIDKNSEEQYIYPCYAYDEGLCSEVEKYHLEY